MVYIDKEFILQNFAGKTGSFPGKADTDFALDEESCVDSFARAGCVSFNEKAFHAEEVSATTAFEAESSDSEESDAKQAWRKLLRLLSVRDRSVRECEIRLTESGFTELSVACAIDRAKRCRLLDDMRYADSFVRAKLASGRGLKGIADSLSSWGIAVENLEGFPDAFLDGEDEFSRACAFISAHPSRSKNVWKSSYAKLLRCGYDSDSAYHAASWYAEKLR